MSILEINDLHTYYGKLHVLRGVSFSAEAGEIVSLLGTNGAGKTTIYRSILGMTKPRRGEVMFKGEDVTGLQTHEIAQRGIGYVPADRGMFPDLTVRDSIEIFNPDWPEGMILNLFPDLQRLYDQKCGSLSGGQQRMVSIARALSVNPELLLLDEPAEGLAPSVVDDVEAVIQDIANEQDICVIVAEHNMEFVERVCERAHLIERGVIQWSGELAELYEDEEMLQQYLGV